MAWLAFLMQDPLEIWRIWVFSEVIGIVRVVFHVVLVDQRFIVYTVNGFSILVLELLDQAGLLANIGVSAELIPV